MNLLVVFYFFMQRWGYNNEFAKLFRWAGVGTAGSKSGAHGTGQYGQYVKGQQKKRRKAEWWEFSKRWRAKGHLYHTAQDRKIHNDDYWMNSDKLLEKREFYLEALDWYPLI